MSGIYKRKGILFCLVGPAGSGKTTVGSKLLDSSSTQLRRSLSVTSRSPRAGEKDGVDYVFITSSAFRDKIKKNEFFEWEEIHGNFYGTPHATLSNSIHHAVDLLLISDVKGAIHVKKANPGQTCIVFLVPPSFDILEKRMKERGAVSNTELASRLETARSEYRAVLEVAMKGQDDIDYIVVNEQIDQTCKQVLGILHSERSRLSRFDPEVLKNICRTS